MWRFLNNIPRALKNYHGPRASIGVYVESDDKDQESASKHESELQNCVVPAASGDNCFCPFKNANIKGATILWRLIGHKNRKQKFDNEDCEHNKDSASHERQQECKGNGFHKEFWTHFQGSNRIYEALVAGSSFLWNLDLKKKDQKHELVYRVLFSAIGKSIATRPYDTLPKLPTTFGQALLAIKDAKGSEQDRIINQKKSEPLESALKEFENICADYTAQNESLLGIMASDEGNMSDAVKHFLTACAMGNKTACFNVGLCYEVGSGVPRNLEKAKRYYELAAMKGHCQAMYNLGLLYLNEDGLLEGRGDIEKGLEWMEMAARSGLSQAQKYMGVYFMEEMNDAKRAVAYFKASASQNDNEARYFLALCHERGLGVEVNECWAAHLYSLAALDGHDEAICNLARFNENGLGGIPVDVEAAIELYSRAAKLGNEEAKQRLEELQDVRERKETTVVYGITSTNELTPKSQPQTPPSLNTSSSSPDLGTFGFSLTDWVYQRVSDFYQTCSDAKPQILYNSRGQVRFQIGRDNGENEMGPGDTVVIGKCAMPQKCSPLHKSNTTPDLTSMVACNI